MIVTAHYNSGDIIFQCTNEKNASFIRRVSLHALVVASKDDPITALWLADVLPVPTSDEDQGATQDETPAEATVVERHGELHVHTEEEEEPSESPSEDTEPDPSHEEQVQQKLRDETAAD